MNSAPWFIATFAVVVGPALTYVVATRKASGKIQTSEAVDLWKESADMRKFLAEQLLKHENRIRELEIENDRLRAEIARLNEGKEDRH